MKARLVLDFSEADLLMPSAVLLFVAELDRLKRLRPDTFRVQIENVRLPRVEQVLQQVGIYALCGVEKKHLKEERFDETVKHWRYATGVRAGDKANQAFEGVEGRLARDLAKHFWKSYSEAIVNSAKHAYLEPRFAGEEDLSQSRWWMFSQEKDGELTVAVCDLGIGIPRSLPQNWEPGIVRRLLAKYQGDGPDVQAVRAAMEVGATSTNEAHRGKGLAQIYNTLRETPGARVVLYSNKARLWWNEEEKSDQSFEHEKSINGTLILWVVKIAENNEERKDHH